MTDEERSSFGFHHGRDYRLLHYLCNLTTSAVVTPVIILIDSIYYYDDLLVSHRKK